MNYIEKQYDDVLGEESKIKRTPKTVDTRVHAMLYFISPTGHSLREIDIELMQRMGKRVNIIPVIAKADSLTTDEIQGFKQRIMEDISQMGIQIFDFPFDESDEPEIVQENKELRNMLPFAVVGSNERIDVNGRTVRARSYPWGVVEVDNVKHSDLVRLKYVLFASHIQDLKDQTQNILYESYRSEKLSQMDIAEAQ